MATNWPFKTIKQNSEWPLHPLLLGIAAGILKTPESERPAVARKQVERAFRLGIRLAKEFGVSGSTMYKIFKAQLVNEGYSLHFISEEHQEVAEAAANLVMDAFKGAHTSDSKDAT